jgi:predicted transcriptional regulator
MRRQTTLHLKVGIATRDYIRDRTINIASGKLKPSRDDPKVWFTSIQDLAAVFSEQSMLLLEILRSSPRFTLEEIAKSVSRRAGDVEGQLLTFQSFGLVDLEEDEEGRITEVKPRQYDRIQAKAKVGKSVVTWDLQLDAA